LNTIAPKDSQVSREGHSAMPLEAACAPGLRLCRCSDTSLVLNPPSITLPLLVLLKSRCTCIFTSMRAKLNMPVWKSAAGA
jgi:hypothetical protein